jgi:hypothetical protein
MSSLARGALAALFAVLVSSAALADDVAVYSEDFDAGNGGYTPAALGTLEGPWVYNGGPGTWSVNGSANVGAPASGTLTSPAVVITNGGATTLRFTHRYSFEYDGTRWDGGQVLVSVNSGPFTPVPQASFTANGYIGVITGNNVLTGQEAFNANSPGYPADFITSVASLGVLNAGDTVAVQFLGAWDEFVQGQLPNWEITSVEYVQSVLPVPALSTWSTALFALLLLAGGFAALRRRPQAVPAGA